MLSHTMKLALVAVGSATLIANQASARTAPKHVSATEAFASVSEMPGSLGGVYTVVAWDGRIVGADPDRNIRFQLMRDALANEN